MTSHVRGLMATSVSAAADLLSSILQLEGIRQALRMHVPGIQVCFVKGFCTCSIKNSVILPDVATCWNCAGCPGF